MENIAGPGHMENIAGQGRIVEIENKLNRIEKLIYQAATDSRRWPSFLEEVGEIFDAKAVVWAECNLNSQTGRICHSVGIDHNFIRSYEERYALRNPWLVAPAGYVSGQVARGEDLIASEELVKTEFYQSWLLPQGLLHRLCAVVKEVNGRAFYISVLRSPESGHFEDDYLQIMKSLIPHLQRATQRGEYSWRSAVTLDIFDNLPFSIFAVDKQGSLLFSNRSAEAILQVGDGIRLHEGKIRTSSRKSDTPFAELVLMAATTTSQQGGTHELGKALLLQRHGKRLPLWAVVSPLARRLRSVIGQEEQVALVFVVSPERLSNISEATLRTMFGLTIAEQRLAKLVVEGYRLDEAAKRLSISINTARTHMKRIYAKTDTGRQTDLIRLLLTGTFNHVFGN